MEKKSKTILLEGKTIYEATTRLAEYCIMNRCFPVGVTKDNNGNFIGEYVAK